MTITILRSLLAALACAAALAFATPSMAAMTHFKADLSRKRSSAQRPQGHRRGDRHL